MIKKGEIVIYVVALMLVTAGYFNYMHIEENLETEETYSEAEMNAEDNNEISDSNIGEAVLVSSNELCNQDKAEKNNNVNVENNEETIEANNNESDGVTETNKIEDDEVTQYYANTKLERNQMYAEMISNYEEILNNSNVSDVQKNIATQEITKINNAKNSIMIIENLILTKGFSNCVLLINDDVVEVVVNIEGGLDTSSVSKIQNIVTRELDIEIENLHITEK